MAKRGLLDPAFEGAKRLYGVLEPEIRRLIGQGYPESVAERIASGELDMRPQARSARQQGMFPDIVYHGSMQDIVGEYMPKYQDNLMFTNVRSLLSAAFDPEYTGSNILGSRIAPTVTTGLLGAGVLMAPEDAEAGVWGAPVREMAERVLKGDGLLFHSGTADQAESLAQSIDPQYGNWLQEIAGGSVDDPENFLANMPEASWYADSPSWVKMKVAQKLKKPVSEVTRDDIEKYGQLSIVDPSTTWDEGAEFWRIPEGGTGEGERTIVENLLGEKMPMYQTPLYSYDDFTGQSNYVFGLEPNDIVTTESIEPMASYTGQDLLDFLDQINNNKTSLVQTGSGNKNTVSIRPDVSIPLGLLADGAMAPKDAEAGVGTKTAQGLMDYIRAYHGSPYRFDKFDMQKIGTGEGNQAYGYGLYFAEAEDVAKTYKQAPEVLDGFDNFAMSDAANKYVIDINKNTDNGLIEYATDELLAGDFTPDTIKRKMRELDDDFTQQEIDSAISEFDKILKNLNEKFSGTMYEVNIKAKPEELLDWDKPLGQQSESVKKAIQATKDKLPPNAVDDLGGDLSLLYGDDVSVGDFLANMQAIGGRADFGESLMNELGIKGISYADQMSRGADGGTKNYVIFDPRIIDISRQYGITIPGASELLYQMENAPKPQQQFDPVNERVQGLMSAIAPEPGYVYGDILPIKRSEDPAARAEFPYGFEPAIPNVARGVLEELFRAYELNKAGRSREATQSAVGALF